MEQSLVTSQIDIDKEQQIKDACDLQFSFETLVVFFAIDIVL